MRNVDPSLEAVLAGCTSLCDAALRSEKGRGGLSGLSSAISAKAASCLETLESAARELTTSRNSTAPKRDGRVRPIDNDFDL